MDPLQLRETTMAPETRRLVLLTITEPAKGKPDPAYEILDKLLAKKRASDRRVWLQEKGNLAEI
jgi:topoisomerase-4 subunit B